MSALSILISLVLVAAFGYFVFSPIMRKQSDKAVVAALTSDKDTQRESLQSEREAIYTAVREIDLDYQTGKITDADYAARREQLMARGVEILKAMDELS